MPNTERQTSFDRFSRVVDGPLMVLAVAMLPLLVLPLVVDLSAGIERIFLALDYLIWAVFAFEYTTKLYLAPDRGQYFRRNIPSLVIVVVPLLRPLRIMRSARALRLLRLARLGAFVAEAVVEVRAVLARRGTNYVLLIALGIVVGGAALVFGFEQGVEGSNIESFPDAVWWAATTITTVGYGDRFPVSAAGRGVAVVLMVTGIAVFGVITASIAAYFVEKEAEPQTDDVAAKLGEISKRLESIEQRLDSS